MAGSFKRDHWDSLGEELGTPPPAPTEEELPEGAEAEDLDADESAAGMTAEAGAEAGPEAEAAEVVVSFDLNDIAAPDAFPMLTVEMEPEPQRLAKPEADELQPGWGAPRKPRRPPERPRPEKRTWTAAADLGVAEVEEESAETDRSDAQPEGSGSEESSEAKSKRRRRRRGGRRKTGDKPEPEAEDAGGPDDATDDDEDEDIDEADEAIADAGTASDSGENERRKREGREGRPSHRNIPTWEEAINLIISTNMEHRAKNPGPSNASRPPHGRGRGGRSRSGEGPGK